ncbi:biotin-dependent carboxyltransferase family protein [Winogradskyella sp.]|uniref:5-oxoprolinase subunit C family protein n=1 Tax=Winogradskyella sp. TaxID=1883156 RepID=UPI002622B048|nr:biotin-dependent carboxyltransferase family protein [Winogradskyella sp.]
MLRVLKSGFYTTIQDVGRFGFRAFGVPVSGAMDSYSSQFANALLGNSKSSALIEMIMVGGIFQFMKPTMIAISGADMNAKLNNEPIEHNRIISINAEDILSFGNASKGVRSYLAIKDGLMSERVLNSQSQYKPITTNGKIYKNDILNYKALAQEPQQLNASVKYDASVLFNNVLDAYKGPEFNKLTEFHRHHLLSRELKISKLNNRMAYQLEPLIANDLRSILTAPVLPGTVQLTPSGNLIVLMRDCQTTGGYPRVLQLTEKAINCLSQKTTGNILKIRLKD